VANLEERLSIVQSARNTTQILPPQPEEVVEREEEDEDEEDGGWGKSKLDGLELKSLTVAQRRKVIMLKGKRERLERERRDLEDDDT
jgi:DASH complex subunit SPC19